MTFGITYSFGSIYNNVVKNNNYKTVPAAGISDTVGIPFGTGVWLAGVMNNDALQPAVYTLAGGIAWLLPAAVVLEVAETDPWVKGDTAQGGTKPARLQTGLMVQVPLFVNTGDRIKVDTRSGDVAVLCQLARPDAVVVTNVGLAHLGIFGSWEEIVRSGAESVEALGEGGVAILNADDPVVRGYATRARGKVITFGLDASADVRAEDPSLGPDARASFLLVSGADREPVELAVPGEHMVSNALAAAACGLWAGMTLAECAAALKGARIARWRMETFVSSDGVRVVNDAYNANPESMAAGLKAARWMAQGARLAAVLGHMAELGPVSEREHERLGELVVRIGVDRLVTVGEPARAIARAAIREGQRPEDVASYDDADGAGEDVRRWARADDVVLVKGSRVAGLERVAEALA